MSSYELIVQLRSEDVHQINSLGQKVTITKEVGGANSGNAISGSKVAWVAFMPFENNQIAWEERYGVYASSTEIQNGAEIFKISSVNPATSGVFYPFSTGSFLPPGGDTGHGGNSYGIENNASVQYTFGLAQSVQANGNKYDANPLNAVGVLGHQKAVFTPIEKITVFLHGSANNGVIMTDITGSALTVDMTDNNDVTIHYDRNKGEFIQGPL